MGLRKVLEKSTHDYSGDGHFRVCARFCGAYFIIVPEPGLPDDRVQAGCRVPEDVDIFGECPKAFRLKVETSYVAPGDRHGMALSTVGTKIEFRIDEATGDPRSYCATPETVLQIREWLAKVAPRSLTAYSVGLEPPSAPHSTNGRDETPWVLSEPTERRVNDMAAIRLTVREGGTLPVDIHTTHRLAKIIRFLLAEVDLRDGIQGLLARSIVTVPVEALVVLRAVAYGPTSGVDKRCAFCNSFPPEHQRYLQAGSPGDCPVIAARKILMDRGESWSLEGRT